VSTDFEAAIGSADLRLFEAIPAELTRNDRISLLRCQGALRAVLPGYVYLEIGSHLGGSIQPHLLDPRCRQVLSIDPRPPVQRDERGTHWGYPGNSTREMLARLTALDAAAVGKVRAIEADASRLDPGGLGAAPNLSFIDGEHSDRAARSDYSFVERASHPRSVVVFHDAPIVYNAIAEIVDRVMGRKGNAHAYHLPDTLFVVETGELTLLDDPAVRALAINNHVGYLAALRLNDGYRRFATRWPFRMMRHFAARVGLRSWAARHDYGLPPADGR
jgi:methyltransferase family protein